MINKFKLVSQFKPKGDQPQAISKLAAGVQQGKKHQVLLGVTGSGKTYTIAKVIEKTQRPTLVISHNKTLAAQTYQELKEFFPYNPVSFFVSYYDYYQPEAYLPPSDTYISKEVDINPLIDRLRLKATANLFSFAQSIVVASVSCIYNIGSPEIYQKTTFWLKKGDKIDLLSCKKRLIELYYQPAESDFLAGTFRQRGNRLDVFLAYSEKEIIQLYFKGQRLAKIKQTTLGKKKSQAVSLTAIYPAKHYLAGFNNLNSVFKAIEQEKVEQIKFFQSQNRLIEAQRIEKKVNYDLQMIKEVGYVNGIENYSRYFDGRQPGEPPFSLLDYFQFVYKGKFLVVIDESHVTIPQIRGMYHGDKARKQTLIDFGFRLPSALDNRPLTFKEFLWRCPQIIYLSATPADWEIKKSQGKIVEQIIRPTGLVDPAIKIKPADKQISDLLKEIKKKKAQGQRVLVITLTKRLAEDLASFFNNLAKTKTRLKTAYLHADIDTLKRTDILASLRKGDFDVLVGINLLREGLDLPEVGLVAILEADKAGFLRSKTSLIQIMGRAARNVNGEIILYADKQSPAMKQAVKEVARRRKIQLAYNKKHGLKPRSIKKQIRPQLIKLEKQKNNKEKIDFNQLTPRQKKKYLKSLEKQMRQAAKILDFAKAAKIRDKILQLR